MGQKVNYLNVGCGGKYHKAWTNIDMNADNPDIISCNLLNGIPFPDNTFDVLYHSQVLEHIPQEDALRFIKECHRVLKPGGIIRVVVPDLENIVDEYKRCLTENLESPDQKTEMHYDWIMLELFDQTIRNQSGGQMARFLQQGENIKDKEYIINRIGWHGQFHFNGQAVTEDNKTVNKRNSRPLIARIKSKIAKLFFGNNYEVGKFRFGGEIHYWMYDRYSLSRLLKAGGFQDIQVKNAYESSIGDWTSYELDVKDGVVYDPTSLFMEAKK